MGWGGRGGRGERRDMQYCDMSRASPPVYFVQVDHREVQERAHVLCGRALPGPAIPNDPDSVHALCIADKRRHSHHIVNTAELKIRFFFWWGRWWGRLVIYHSIGDVVGEQPPQALSACTRSAHGCDPGLILVE